LKTQLHFEENKNTFAVVKTTPYMD